MNVTEFRTDGGSRETDYLWGYMVVDGVYFEWSCYPQRGRCSLWRRNEDEPGFVRRVDERRHPELVFMIMSRAAL